MSKPLLQPGKFKNSLDDNQKSPTFERKKSNEGTDEPKSPLGVKNDNFSKSPKANSPLGSDGGYEFHAMEDGVQNGSERNTGAFFSSKNQTTQESASKGGASFTLKADGKTFVASFGEIENDFENESIFKQLCPEDKYQEANNCIVCQKAFGMLMLSRRHHCKFCGNSVCDEHSKKRRSDPNTPGNYVRICDVCDRKYINKMILDEFKGKLKRRDDELKELENKSAQYQKKFKEKQNTYDNQISEKNRKEKELNDKINMYVQKTVETKEEIKRVEKENLALNAKYAELHSQNEELEKKIQELRREEEEQLKESDTLTQKIQAIEQDISQINKIIEEYDRTLANNKIYATPGEPKNKNITYNANSDALKAVQNSINNLNEGGKQNNPKGSLIANREGGYTKNEKPDTGSCNTGCRIF